MRSISASTNPRGRLSAWRRSRAERQWRSTSWRWGNAPLIRRFANAEPSPSGEGGAKRRVRGQFEILNLSRTRPSSAASRHLLPREKALANAQPSPSGEGDRRPGEGVTPVVFGDDRDRRAGRDLRDRRLDLRDPRGAGGWRGPRRPPPA